MLEGEKEQKLAERRGGARRDAFWEGSQQHHAPQEISKGGTLEVWGFLHSQEGSIHGESLKEKAQFPS